jgi:hypothetical protein
LAGDAVFSPVVFVRNEGGSYRGDT